MLVEQTIIEQLKQRYKRFSFEKQKFGSETVLIIRATLGRFVGRFIFGDDSICGYSSSKKMNHDTDLKYSELFKKLFIFIED